MPAAIDVPSIPHHLVPFQPIPRSKVSPSSSSPTAAVPLLSFASRLWIKMSNTLRRQEQHDLMNHLNDLILNRYGQCELFSVSNRPSFDGFPHMGMVPPPPPPISVSLDSSSVMFFRLY